MRRILHKLAHVFGVNGCRSFTWIEGNEVIVGHRCCGCGELYYAWRKQIDGPRRFNDPPVFTYRTLPSGTRQAYINGELWAESCKPLPQGAL